jgi:hypothetical protein
VFASLSPPLYKRPLLKAIPTISSHTKVLCGFFYWLGIDGINNKFLNLRTYRSSIKPRRCHLSCASSQGGEATDKDLPALKDSLHVAIARSVKTRPRSLVAREMVSSRHYGAGQCSLHMMPLLCRGSMGPKVYKKIENTLLLSFAYLALASKRNRSRAETKIIC